MWLLGCWQTETSCPIPSSSSNWVPAGLEVFHWSDLSSVKSADESACKIAAISCCRSSKENLGAEATKLSVPETKNMSTQPTHSTNATTLEWLQRWLMTRLHLEPVANTNLNSSPTQMWKSSFLPPTTNMSCKLELEHFVEEDLNLNRTQITSGCLGRSLHWSPDRYTVIGLHSYRHRQLPTICSTPKHPTCECSCTCSAWTCMSHWAHLMCSVVYVVLSLRDILAW